MNAQFVNVLSLLAYFVVGSVGIALLVTWALKRSGSPGQSASKSAPTHNEPDSQKADRAAIPRSDHKTPRQQML